jgi:hypothetical protein
MATSTNYGWAEPDNSSLVKNGASDIRTLGNAIDVSLWNSGFGQAGKNKFINGDFSINQRTFTSNAVNQAYGFDRWRNEFSGGTCTQTPQTFTAGTAPVAGYEFTNYLQIITASQSAAGDYAMLTQRIENVRTFANQTVTMSFWAKAASGTPKISFEFQQNFGSGGSPSSQVNTYAGQATLSTSWARYTITATCPSISGLTVGTTANTSYLGINFWLSAGSTFNTRSGSIGIQNATFNIAGIQLEYGSTATPFQLAGGGDPQSELAMCQRYYHRFTGGSTSDALINSGLGFSTTVAMFIFHLGTTMRIAPSTMEVSNQGVYNVTTGVAYSGGTWALNQQFDNSVRVIYTHGSPVFTLGATVIGSSTSSSNYFAFSAEL